LGCEKKGERKEGGECYGHRVHEGLLQGERLEKGARVTSGVGGGRGGGKGKKRKKKPA